MDSQYLNLEQKDFVVVVSWLYLPSSFFNDFNALLVSPFMSWFLLIISIYCPPPSLHVAQCWDIVRTTCYKELPLVSCRVNSWWIFFSIRGCSSLWLTRKRLPIVTNYWCHMTDTLYLNSFKLFQYVMVDGCGVNWTKWKKCWSILFWSSCWQASYNFLDSVFCDLYVVLQREYKFFTLLLELHKVFINLWISDGATFLWMLHFWFVVNDWIPIKIFGTYGEWVQNILPYRCTWIVFVILTHTNI